MVEPDATSVHCFSTAHELGEAGVELRPKRRKNVARNRRGRRLYVGLGLLFESLAPESPRRHCQLAPKACTGPGDLRLRVSSTYVLKGSHGIGG